MDHEDDERVREGIARLMKHGNGAHAQRRTLHTEGTLARIVTRCAELTTE